MMKKLAIVLVVILTITISGCSNSETSSVSDPGTGVTTQHVEIKESPDKYTAYIKDYVNRNCAVVGYQSMGGDRNDYIGEGYIHLIMITENGEYVGVSNEELKNYVVVAQSLAPNTEVKFTYEKNSEGKEYDSLIEWQSIDEIVLKVRPIGSKKKTTEKGMTAINPDPDKYTSYVKDYVGRNLASCGYISMLGDYRDVYGVSNIQLVIVPDDGSYFDLGDENILELLKQYVVVGQSISPNTEIKYEFEKNSDGEEYNFVSWKNRKEIELYVSRI